MVPTIVPSPVAPPKDQKVWKDYAAEICTLTDTIERERDRIERQRADLLQQFQAHQSSNIARRDQLMDAVRIYFEAHREELLPRGRKSMHLARGTIGTRTARWAIEVTDFARALRSIFRRKLEHLVRIKLTLRKEAAKEFLSGRLRIPGLTLRQRERFFFELHHPAVVFSHDERGFRWERKKVMDS